MATVYISIINYDEVRLDLNEKAVFFSPKTKLQNLGRNRFRLANFSSNEDIDTNEQIEQSTVLGKKLEETCLVNMETNEKTLFLHFQACRDANGFESESATKQ